MYTIHTETMISKGTDSRGFVLAEVGRAGVRLQVGVAAAVGEGREAEGRADGSGDTT